MCHIFPFYTIVSGHEEMSRFNLKSFQLATLRLSPRQLLVFSAVGGHLYFKVGPAYRVWRTKFVLFQNRAITIIIFFYD